MGLQFQLGSIVLCGSKFVKGKPIPTLHAQPDKNIFVLRNNETSDFEGCSNCRCMLFTRVHDSLIKCTDCSTVHEITEAYTKVQCKVEVFQYPY